MSVYVKRVGSMDKSRGYSPKQGKPKRDGGLWDYNFGEEAEKVRLIPGTYGTCEGCGIGVTCDESGNYECKAPCWVKNDDGQWQMDGECGEKGQLDLGSVSPVFINYGAWVPGAWKARKGRFVTSNNNAGRLDRPCLLAYNEDKIDGLSIGSRFAHTMIRLGEFHKIHDQKGEKTYYNFEPCTGRRCAHCKSNVPAVKAKVMGQKEWINPGYMYYKHLVSIAREVGRKCLSCDDGQIACDGWACSACDEMQIDAYNTDLSDAELMAWGEKAHRCTKCGDENFPTEKITCVTYEHPDDPASGQVFAGCDNPVRTEIFDVDLRIKRADKALQMTWVSKPKPIDPEVAALAVPIDFAAKLGWCNPSDQAKLMNRGNVFAGEDGGVAETGKSNRQQTTSY